MSLGLELLGGVRASIDGSPVDVGGRRPRTLLACLALADGHAVGIDRLVDLLWDDDPPPTARQTLQSYVSRLRRVLGGDHGPLSAGGAGYVLEIERDQVDLFIFADTVAGAKDEAATDPAGAAARLGAALESWATPLDGLRPSLALQAILAPYEELRLEAIETLNDIELDHGQVGRAVGRLESLVREHPVRERFWAQLIRGLAALGRRDAALHASQRAREKLREHLGVTPSPLLLRVERDVLDGGPLATSPAGTAPPEVVPGNLVRSNTEFVGRSAELEQAAAELSAHRVVTFCGAGGIGKTRLATELGWSIADTFPGGAWLVELAPLADPDAAVAAVASTLSIFPQRDMTTVEAIVDWLQGRHLILILDNCEHVLTPVSNLVATVADRCPGVTLLATSREPLGVSGERVHLVHPLDPPSEGFELFCARARAADASFVPTAEDRAVITDICGKLDGIPLAIELAAAQIRALSPPDLLARLDERFGLLHGTRGGSDRHHTMRATTEWSYRLLEEPERLLFERLAVFAGGFDLAAVEAVCADDGLGAETVAGALRSLVDKSLVVADRSGHGMRYRLLEPMRQYGDERLQKRADTTRRRDRHLQHYLEIARRTNELWLSPRQVDADATFERECDNLRAAHRWAVTTANLAAAETLIAMTAPHAWCRLNHEHGDLARRTLTLDAIDRRVNPATYGWAAYWAYVADRDDRVVEATARRGIDAAPGPEHPDTSACWAVLIWNDVACRRRADALESATHGRVAAETSRDLFSQWWVAAAVIEAEFASDRAAIPDMTRIAALTETIGAPSLQARTAFYRGWHRLRVDRSDSEGVLSWYRKGLDLATGAGDVINANVNLIGIVSAETRSQTARARDVSMQAILKFLDARHWTAIWLILGAIADWWDVTGRLEPAAVIQGHLDAHQPRYSDRHARSGRLPATADQPGGQQLMARGAAMDRHELVNFVLKELDTPGNEPD